MTRVLVFGVFDFFHPGHLGFLRLAGRYGDEIIVSVARDKFVASHKGRKPLFNENERLARISDLPFVSNAVLSDEITGSYSVIKEFMPNVICFGHDQNELEQHCGNWLAENNIPVKTLKLPKVPHIRKDFAFIRADRDIPASRSGFLEVSENSDDNSERIFSFLVYDRQGKLKASAGWDPAEKVEDLVLAFPGENGLPEKYASLIRETARFYKYYTGSSRKEIKINLQGILPDEVDGFDFENPDDCCIVRVKTD